MTDTIPEQDRVNGQTERKSQIDPSPPASRSLPAGGLLHWLIIGVVGLAVLALAGVHAPPQLKKIGLFTVGWGVVAGWGLQRLAREVGFERRRLAVPLAFGLIIAAQIGVGVQSYRLYAIELRQSIADDPQSALAAQLLASLPPGEDAESDRFAPLAGISREESFTGYLQHRVSSLGRWPAPWPAVFWAVELLLAGAAGGWIVSRQDRRSA